MTGYSHIAKSSNPAAEVDYAFPYPIDNLDNEGRIMSTNTSSVKLEEVSRSAVTDTDAEAANPTASAPSAETAAPSDAPATPPPPGPVNYNQPETDQKDRYGRGIIVGILFSCFVALIPLSIGMSIGTKQQDNLISTRAQVLDLRANLVQVELQELQTRLADIAAAEQRLVALLQEKSSVNRQIDAKQSELNALRQEAGAVRNQAPSLLEEARNELNMTVGDTLSKIAD